jgi:hypothetical protein
MYNNSIDKAKKKYTIVCTSNASNNKASKLPI